MKPEFDKEIEALLRGQQRNVARVGRSGTAAHADSTHLDADELSAYAENALPPATRARFTAHLADCDDCRRITTGIALAAGVATVGAEKRASLAATAAGVAVRETRGTTGGVLEWLAALFSPRALRYAIPLLAVALTGVVAYVALRSKQDGALVAGRMENEAQRQVSATTNNTAQEPASTTASNAPAASVNSSATGLNGPQTTDVRKDDASAPPAKEGQTSAEPVTVDGRTAAQTSAAPPDDAKLADASKTAAAQPEQAKTSVPAAPKPAESEHAEVTSGELSRAEKKEQSTLGRNAERRGQDEDAPGGAQYETKKRSQNAPPPANAGARARSARDAGEFAAQRNARRGNSTEEDRADAGDRRAVAGYTFRRQGDKWVDERYGASMATSNISRGGDRFRSLAADFPEVEPIASQLPGTVIVVLRGRAYRID